MPPHPLTSDAAIQGVASKAQHIASKPRLNTGKTYANADQPLTSAGAKKVIASQTHASFVSPASRT
jgi:hypothetical protein